jgi:hypothetical protein
MIRQTGAGSSYYFLFNEAVAILLLVYPFANAMALIVVEFEITKEPV